MKQVKVSIFLVLFLSISQFTFAANNSGRVSIGYFTINSDYLTIYADAGYTFVDDNNCQSAGTNYRAVVIERSKDGFNELYAAVMLGLSSDMTISFWLDGSCSPNTQGGPFPIATSVYLYK